MTAKVIMPERIVDLVVPLAHNATALRTTDTACTRHDRSGAACGPSHRPAGEPCTTGRPTSATPVTPGTRISTTATRTTGTPTTSCAPAPSADRPPAGHTGFSFAALLQAYLDCRRHKRNTASALTFEARLESNLCRLADDLEAGTYTPGPSVCFVVTRPRPREVWAADFRDRIVHHLVYNHIGAAIEATFIADSCACIPGRGTLYAARRLEGHARSQTAGWTRPGYYLKCDVANFFVSIDKRILGQQLAARINSPWWRALTLQILHHDPRPGAIVRGSPAEHALVPPHKRLAEQPAHRGLPIGNLSSQFFANVYLNALDQFIKHVLGCRHYTRYVDDFILLHRSPQQLNAWHAAISTYLQTELGLSLNPRKTILQPIERGIDFVGQIIRPHHRITRRNTLHSALQRLASLPASELHASANSSFGSLRQATHSHADRCRLANLLRRRGMAIDGAITKTFRSTP